MTISKMKFEHLEGFCKIMAKNHPHLEKYIKRVYKSATDELLQFKIDEWDRTKKSYRQGNEAAFGEMEEREEEKKKEICRNSVDKIINLLILVKDI